MTLADLIDERLAISAAVATRLHAGPRRPLAVAVVGSTALGRCSATSDLDLVAILHEPDELPPVTSQRDNGVRVDVEWTTAADALADTAGDGDGWTWELRKAARLGSALPLIDPDGFFDRLSVRAAAMRPEPRRYAEHLHDIEALLAVLDAGDGDPRSRGEALRAALDSLAMLALLASPRRYQKAKWTIDDLLDIDQEALAVALLDAYGARAPAADPLAGARAFVDAALARVGAPSAAALAAMGHTPGLAAESYVARTLEDADGLADAGRSDEARYVAGFALRQAAGLLPRQPGAVPFEAVEAAGLGASYLACFPPVRASAAALATAHRAARGCADWLATQEAVA